MVAKEKEVGKLHEGLVSYVPIIVSEFKGKHSISIKIEGKSDFFRINETKEKLERLIPRIPKGTTIKFQADNGFIVDASTLEVTKEASKEAVKENKPNRSGNWADDMTNFEQLLNSAHQKGLISIETEMLDKDLDKKYALFKATVTMNFQDNKMVSIATFTGHGDATAENVTNPKISIHFIRMAETRAIVRALRFATNNAKVAEEETD